MRLPARGSSAETLLLEFGLYHEARMQGDPICLDLAGSFHMKQEDLRRAIGRYRDTQAVTLTALAERDGAETKFIHDARAFGFEITAKVDNKYETALFRTYFPSKSRAIRRGSLKAKLSLVDTIVVKLADETDPDIKAHAEPLGASGATLRAAIDTYEGAVQGESTAYGLLRVEVLRWFETYESDYYELKRRFVKEPWKVETFFRPPRSVRRSGGDDNEVPAENGGGVAEASADAADRKTVAEGGGSA